MSGDPFASLHGGATLSVSSISFSDGSTLPLEQCSGRMGVHGGRDISPQLSWSGAPQGTLSYAISVHDPDAPGAGGFWHWAAVDIPASVTSLSSGAGAEDGASLPSGAKQLKNDGDSVGYLGAAPPRGHGLHHYIVRVHALDVEHLNLPSGAHANKLPQALKGHVLATGRVTGTFSR